ncbi:MAG: glycosyltransferase family A protein [Pseudolabrys sp.]
MRRTLASITRERRPIFVVDDGSSLPHHLLNSVIARAYGSLYLHYPVNLGLANAINVGVGHWLAHADVEWISVFNDDVEVVRGIFENLADVTRQSSELVKISVYTGYLDDLHPVIAGRSLPAGPSLLPARVPQNTFMPIGIIGSRYFRYRLRIWARRKRAAGYFPVKDRTRIGGLPVGRPTPRQSAGGMSWSFRI